MWLKSYLIHQKSKEINVNQEGKATALDYGLMNIGLCISQIAFPFLGRGCRRVKMFLPFLNSRRKECCLCAS